MTKWGTVQTMQWFGGWGGPTAKSLEPRDYEKKQIDAFTYFFGRKAEGGVWENKSVCQSQEEWALSLYLNFPVLSKMTGSVGMPGSLSW